MLLCFVFCCSCFAQKQNSNTTPVPILRQINRHNEDGSYSYGYEGADGSFKIETKQANGEVKGKYGYVDTDGKLREIEYGANENGFQASGDGIQAAPPTVNNVQSSYPALGPDEVDDGQYREDPKIYEDPRYNSKSSKSSQFRPASNFNYAPAVQSPPARTYSPAPAAPVRSYSPATPVRNYEVNTEAPIQQEPQQNYYQSRFQAPAQSNYYQPPQQNYYRQPSNNYYQNPSDVNIFQGHPASDLNLQTGSYSVSYSG